jgi:hypothetical protein
MVAAVEVEVRRAHLLARKQLEAQGSIWPDAARIGKQDAPMGILLSLIVDSVSGRRLTL